MIVFMLSQPLLAAVPAGACVGDCCCCLDRDRDASAAFRGIQAAAAQCCGPEGTATCTLYARDQVNAQPALIRGAARAASDAGQPIPTLLQPVAPPLRADRPGQRTDTDPACPSARLHLRICRILC